MPDDILKRSTPPFINVKDFGIAGDGSVDVAEKLQALIDTVMADGGGTVFFPCGLYTFGKTITIGPHAAPQDNAPLALVGEAQKEFTANIDIDDNHRRGTELRYTARDGSDALFI